MIHNNLGNALRELGQLDEAEAELRRAIELRPAYAEAHNNLGVVLVKQHRVDDGISEYRLAIKHKRGYAEAHLNRALAWLLLGDFQQGWPEYEWRWKSGLKLLNCAQARWDGDLLEGKTLLLQSEQGLGDTLQFARYAALLRERGARVLLRCRKSLHPLLTRTPGIGELVAEDLQLRDGPHRSPPPEGEGTRFDCWSPLLSIPRLMLTTLDRIPSNGPYLFADEQFVEEWRHRLPHTDSFKVGICWQGGVRFVTDRQRSFPLESFSPLAAINGVELISLQKGEPESLAHGGGSAGPALEDDRLSWLTVLQGERDQSRGAFMDTAAIIMNLDLVITCDTSIAHLAGGLGMPVWVILQHAADWRWLLDRDDSPWYPTMRLFRQSSPGDWTGVFQRVTDALRELVAWEDGLPRPSSQKRDGLGRPSSFFTYPQGSLVWNRRAIAAAKRGRLPEAISLFRRAVRFQADSAEMANNLGNALRNHGELSEAMECLQRAVGIKPHYADAHHNLGLIYARQRRFDEAIAAFQHAIELKPGFAQCRNSLGQAFTDLGRHAEAENSFRRAVESDTECAGQKGDGYVLCEAPSRPFRQNVPVPFLAVAFNNLGNALTNQGKRKEAVTCFERAVKLNPKFADAFNNLGNVLRELRHHAKAIAAFERAVAIRPNFLQAHNNMGITYSARRKYDEALACYECALQIWPEYAAAHNNRGITLANRGDWADATASYRRALELKPDYAEAMNNLGIVLSQQGDYEGALALFKQAIELKPDYAEAFSNMGITLTECRRIDEALESYAQALERKENYPDARMNRALSYLIQGDFERGWKEYEWRWKCKEFNARNFEKPQWDGSPLEGRRIMFHTEQGFGDTFQFIRYVRLVKERHNCTAIVWCPKQLIPFLSQIPYIDELTIEGEPIPEIDVHVPLLSMPRVLDTRVETVPSVVPYLFAKPALVDRWRKELSYIRAFKIGIAWKGNPRYRGDHHRSMPLEKFAALADVPGVRLISLQKGLGTEQIAALDDRFSLTELPRTRDEKAGPFMDTAAIVKNLDLVISCDSSLTHLAGGLGVPVWLAQSLASDWRWLLNREDSPWYPTLRIFRQKSLGDWDEVFQRMATEVQKLVQASGRGDSCAGHLSPQP